MDFVAELWRFMRARKKFWLLPMILVFAIMGALLVITQSSAIAPFIYTCSEPHASARYFRVLSR